MEERMENNEKDEKIKTRNREAQSKLNKFNWMSSQVKSECNEHESFISLKWNEINRFPRW